MKITVVGLFGMESFAVHIAENLEAMGHTVRRVAYTREHHGLQHLGKMGTILRVAERQMHYASARARAMVMKPVIEDVCAETADLVITTFDYFRKSELAEIRAALPGVRLAMWFPDHVKSFDRAFFMTAGYDALFFKDPFLVKSLYDIYEMNVYYLPEAFSKLRHTVTDDFDRRRAEYDCDIAMIGSQHSLRVPLLEKLSAFDIRLYGAGSPWWLDADKLKKFYTGKFAAYHEKANVFCGAKIALNTLYIAEVEGVNVRAFEISGAGGFQLIQWKPGLADLFDIDREVTAYRTAAELREKIRYYLQQPEKRREIAQAGKERAWKDHSYEPRLQRLLDMVMGSPAAARETRLDYRVL